MRHRAATSFVLLAGIAGGVPALAAAATAVPVTPVAAASNASVASTTPAASGASTVLATTPIAGALATTPAAASAFGSPDGTAANATLPLNTFSVVGKAKIARDGTVSLVVQPQAAGKFTAFAMVPAPANDLEAGAASVRPSPQPAAVPLPYGTADTFLPSPQPVRLYFRPGKAGRDALVRLKRPTTTLPLRVTLDVSFAPLGGTINTVVYVVKIYPSAITLK